MAKLKRISNIVLRVLTDHEEARKDDFVLMGYVLDELGVPTNFDMRTMLHNHVMFGLPSFESITRARRKVQAQYEELKDAKAVEIRAAEQNDFMEFARGKYESKS